MLYWPCTIQKDVQALHYTQGCAGPVLCAGLYSPCTIRRVVQALYYLQRFVGPALYGFVQALHYL